MAAFYILAVDDREYKLKLTTASKIEAEKRLGFSLLEAPENITRAETFAVILWAALQKYHRTMTLPKVYDSSTRWRTMAARSARRPICSWRS